MEDKNLAHLITTMPAELVAMLAQLKTAARARGYQLYLVGGAVRDLLLGLPVRDADTVVLGSAIALAEDIAPAVTEFTAHPAFGTATVSLGDMRLDLSSARTESYGYPGALPTVRPGTLRDDLGRRDFTVNAMAVSLNENDYGQLYDYCSGIPDLASGIIRTLHNGSFTDDPTRIWRAVRYEQRLGFKIEPITFLGLRRNLAGLKKISGDRVWHELSCILSEEAPEKALARLSQLGVLKLLSPALRADSWLAEMFRATRTLGIPSITQYLALFTYRLAGDEADMLSDYLRLNNRLRGIMQDTRIVKARLRALARTGIKPSTVYRLLSGIAPEALRANLIASASPRARNSIVLYQDKLQAIKTSLTGDDLTGLGVPPGPQVGNLLQKLLEARLNGLAQTRADELSLARRLAVR